MVLLGGPSGSGGGKMRHCSPHGSWVCSVAVARAIEILRGHCCWRFGSVRS